MTHPLPTTAPTASADGAAPAVRVAGLGVRIDGRGVLQDVSFDVAPGEFLAVLGANGAGKSTLLKVLATLLPPTSGDAALFGHSLKRDTAQVRSRIGLVAHQSMLYRDLSARENLLFFARLYGVKNPADRVNRLLEAIGLADRANDPVKAFSRGMAQRVSIARALVHEPQLLLADEPFAGLDAPSIEGLETLLRRLHERGRTVLMVNHDIPQSLALATRAIVLRGGQVVADAATRTLDAARVLAEVQS